MGNKSERGRKPKMRERKMVKTSLSLPEDVWKAARIKAIERGVDAQDIVAEALEKYLGKGGVQ